METHNNPWGRWQNIAQRAHWGEPGYFAFYIHDGWSDSYDVVRSGEEQVQPWFKMYKYDLQSESWVIHQTELPNIDLTSYPDWREVVGWGTFPDTIWDKESGEYADWEFQYGFESLGGGRLWFIGWYLVRYDATVDPWRSWRRYVGFTTVDDGLVWTAKDSYPAPPVDTQLRCDVDPCVYVALDTHRFNWNDPTYIGDDTIMYHRTFPMHSDDDGAFSTGTPTWGNVEYQEIHKNLKSYELNGYVAKGWDEINDTDWKTWDGGGGDQISNAWHLSKICYLGKTGDSYPDPENPLENLRKKSMLVVCFNKTALRHESNYYYLENCERGIWRTDDEGYSWQYLGTILNDGASWTNVACNNNNTFQHAYHQLEYLGGGRILGIFTIEASPGIMGVRAFISEDRGVTWNPHGMLPWSAKIPPWLHPPYLVETTERAAFWIWPFCACETVQYLGKVKKLHPLQPWQTPETQEFTIEDVIIASVFWVTESFDIELGWSNKNYAISKDGGETWEELEADVPIRNESRLIYNEPIDLPQSNLYSTEDYNDSLEHMVGYVFYQEWANPGYTGLPTGLVSSYNNGAVPSLSAEFGESGIVYDAEGNSLGRPALDDFEEETRFIEVIALES